MGIQRPRDHARRERGEVLPQAPREREACQARSFPPRRRTLRRRNRDRQRASIQKATWHRSGATDRTTELVELTGAGSSAPPRGRAALPASSTILETRVMCSPGLEVEVELAAP